MIEGDKQPRPAHLDRVADSQDCESTYRLQKLRIRLKRCMISAAMCSLLELLPFVPLLFGYLLSFHGNEVELKPPENDRMPCMAEILSELWLYKALPANRHK